MNVPARGYYHFIPSRFPERHFAAVAERAGLYYRRFDAEVPGVIAALFGRNESPHGAHFTHLRLAAFHSFAAHEAYQRVPLHDDIVAFLRGLAEDMVAADVADPRPMGPPASVYSLTLLRPHAAGALPSADAEAQAEAARRDTPGLAFLELRPNISPFAKGWTHLVAAAFASRAACAAFEGGARRAALMVALAPGFAPETVAVGGADLQ